MKTSLTIDSLHARVTNVCSPSNHNEFRSAEFLFPGYPICDHADHGGCLERATQVPRNPGFCQANRRQEVVNYFLHQIPHRAQSGPGSAKTLNPRRKCRKLLASVPGKSMSKSSIPNQPASTNRRRDHEAEYCIIVSLIRCVVLSKRPLR